MTQHPGFEKAIDENPLEATTHLAYADWHDENGNPDEAAFRRTMGEWVGRLHNAKVSIHDPRPVAEDSRLNLPNFPWRVTPTLLPETVPATHIEHSRTVEDTSKAPYHARSYGWDGVFPLVYRWATYRGMEDAFRRSFMANRKKNLSRTASAVARVIRGGN